MAGLSLGLSRLSSAPRVLAAQLITASYDSAARTLSGTAPASIELVVTIDGADQTPHPVSNVSGAWSFQVGTLSNGTHSYAVRAANAVSGSLTFGSAPSAGGTLDFTDPANSGHASGF